MGKIIIEVKKPYFFVTSCDCFTWDPVLCEGVSWYQTGGDCVLHILFSSAPFKVRSVVIQLIAINVVDLIPKCGAPFNKGFRDKSMNFENL